MYRISTLAVAVFELACMTGCESDALTGTDSHSGSESDIQLSKKPDNPGGGTGDVEPLAAWFTGDAGWSANTSGARVGGNLTIGLDLIWDPSISEFVRDEVENTTHSACEGWRFGLLEVLEKGGQTSDVILRAYDGNGSDINSDKVAIAGQSVTPGDGAQVVVDRDIAMREGRGKNGSVVCTVHIDTIYYESVSGS